MLFKLIHIIFDFQIDKSAVNYVLDVYKKVDLVPSMLKACTKVAIIPSSEDSEDDKLVSLRVTFSLVSWLVHSERTAFLTQVCQSLRDSDVSQMFHSLVCKSVTQPTVAVHLLSIVNKVLSIPDPPHFTMKTKEISNLLSKSIDSKDLISKLLILYALNLRLELRELSSLPEDKSIFKVLDSLEKDFPNEVKFCRKFLLFTQ